MIEQEGLTVKTLGMLGLFAFTIFDLRVNSSKGGEKPQPAVRGGEKRRHFRRAKAEPTEPGRRSRPAV